MLYRNVNSGFLSNFIGIIFVLLVTSTFSHSQTIQTEDEFGTLSPTVEQPGADSCEVQITCDEDETQITSAWFYSSHAMFDNAVNFSYRWAKCKLNAADTSSTLDIINAQHPAYIQTLCSSGNLHLSGRDCHSCYWSKTYLDCNNGDTCPSGSFCHSSGQCLTTFDYPCLFKNEDCNQLTSGALADIASSTTLAPSTLVPISGPTGTSTPTPTGTVTPAPTAPATTPAATPPAAVSCSANSDCPLTTPVCNGSGVCESFPAPTASGVSPAVGSLYGGTLVTIFGTGFQPGVTVTFGGSDCAFPTPAPSGLTITCMIPPGSGAVDAVITNTDGQSVTLQSVYLYDRSPLVWNVSPPLGTSLGGTLITLLGAGFLPGATVAIGSIPCTGVTVISSIMITCTTAAGIDGDAIVSVTNPDGLSGSSPGLFYYNPPVMVSSVTPGFGPTTGGTFVTLSGNNFVSGLDVKVGNSHCNNIALVSPTLVTCNVPAGPAGTQGVSVISPDGQIGFLTNGFTYYAPPIISTVTPSVGPTTGGTLVTVNGTGFSSNTAVLLGTASCAVQTINTAGTTLTCTSSPAAAGIVSATVTNPDGQTYSKSNAFSYGVPPTIVSVSPNTGLVQGGTAITISGSGFVSGVNVKLGTSNCNNTVLNSSTSISCTTPSGTGSVDVLVTNPDTQFASLQNGFTYITPPPDIITFSPMTGPLAGGNSITITGTGFRTGATVKIGNNSCTNSSITSTTISCLVPAGTEGSVGVKVTNPDGQSKEIFYYTYRAAPSVLSVTPSSGRESGGFVATVEGSRFYGAPAVYFGGVPCTGVILESSIRLTCIIPSGNPGPVAVSVTNPDGQTGTRANAFTYNPTPTITGVIPSSVSVVGGTTISVLGTNFISGAVVRVGSNICTQTFASSIWINCIVPPGNAGPAQVNVINPDGQVASAGPYAFYYENPSLSQLSPNSGSIAGGNFITVYGQGFTTGLTVKFGNIPSPNCNFISINELSCQVPTATAAGTVSVTMSNSYNNYVSTLPNAYTYLIPGNTQTVFVTAMAPKGSLGGLMGADSTCRTIAAAGTKTKDLAGSWKAILSDSTNDAKINVILKGYPLVNTNGDLLLLNSSQLWTTSMIKPISYDENGTLISYNYNVWSGTNSSGTKTGGVTTVAYCDNWQSNSQSNSGTVGLSNTITEWISNPNSGTIGCDNKVNDGAHLYCINWQPAPPPDPTPSPSPSPSPSPTPSPSPQVEVTLLRIAVTPEVASTTTRRDGAQFTATAYYSNGTSADISTRVVWTSSNTDVVQMDTNGFAWVQSKGTAKVTATFMQNMMASAQITVSK